MNNDTFAPVGCAGEPGPPPSDNCGLSRVAVLIAVTLAGLLGSVSAGCYRRVIATHGLGTETVTTEEPYQESGEIDRWLFGDKPNERKP